MPYFPPLSPVKSCRRLLFLSGLALLPLCQAGEIKLEGPEPLVLLLKAYLPTAEVSQRSLQKQLTNMLATEGYFSPQFDFGDEDAESRIVTINPGERTLITAVDITIDGVVEATALKALRAEWLLPVGQPFRQADWDKAKNELLATLLARDFAAAQLLDSEAEIDPLSHSAHLTLHYAAGAKYVFGEIRVKGMQRYDAELANKYNRGVHAGEPFSQDKLNALQTSLQSSPYFSNVLVGLDMEAAEPQADGRVSAPVLITVSEQSVHRYRVGAGVSSNTGARVEFNYQTPNFLNQPWLLDAGIRLEQKKQTTYADVFLPPRDDNSRFSVGAMDEHTDIQELKTDMVSFGAQQVIVQDKVERRLSINWKEETRNPTGGVITTARALVPNSIWTWRQLDKPLDPTHGVVLQGQIGGGAKAALSDENFLRLYGRYQQFIPLSENNRLILRGELGHTLTANSKLVPQDYLFRTGGATSVRGYTYQSLGIKEGSAVVGGQYLVVASAEVTHWLDEQKGIAFFVDAGDAFDTLAGRKLAYGYGIGGRWRSPAGPIGVDIAYGERTQQVQLHFNLAIPF